MPLKPIAANPGPEKKVYLLKPRGFCAGVVRAIDVVNIALDLYGPPIYVRKEIVHNKHVVEELRAAGAIFVEEIAEVPAGARAIFSAHGVAPEVRRQAAARYHTLLETIYGLERPPLALPRREISWFVYVVRLPEGVNRDRVREQLAGQGIATGRYFAPIHLQPAWRARSGAERLALTESIARRTLALPFFNRITSEQQEQVAAALRAAIQSAA